MNTKYWPVLFIATVFFSMFTSPLFAVTVCNSPSLTIPDNDSTGISDTINLTDTANIYDLNVIVNVTHGHVGELAFKLVHNSTTVTLLDRPGIPATTIGCYGQNISGLRFDDEGTKNAENNCTNTSPAYDNTFAYTPANSLSAFDGQTANGTWTLTVSDQHTFNVTPGTLAQWCLEYQLASNAGFSSTPPPGTTLSFGDSQLGVTASYTLPISNSGGGDNLIIYSAAITGPAASDFAVVDPTSFAFTISAGNNYTFKIDCTPSWPGTRSATITFSTNINTTPFFSYPLSCNGIAPTYTLSTASGSTLNFGSSDIGVTSATTQTLHIQETSNQVDLIVSAALTGTHPADFSITSPASFPYTITKNTSGSIALACTPSGGGERKAKLTVTTNNPSATGITYNLTCIGNAPVYQSSPVAPNQTLIFGTSIPPASVTKTLTVKNSGTKDLTINSISLTGASEFTLSPLTTPLTIGIGVSQPITITCAPTSEIPYTATLTVTTNDPSYPTIGYPLTCSGTTATEPLYDSVPVHNGTIDFGNSVVGTSVNNTFLIREVGNTTLEVINPVIAGTHASDFALVSPTFPISILENGEDVTVTLKCTPSAGGSRTAILELTSNAPNYPSPRYTLNCNGLTPGYGSTPVSGNLIDFGSKSLGQTVTKALTVQETGGAALTVGLAAPVISGTHASDFSVTNPTFPFTINDGGANKVVTVACTPSGLGIRTATLNLTSNDPANPTPSYLLQCTGLEAVGPGYSSTPFLPNDTLDFGNVQVGAAKNMTFDIKEVGNVVLEVNLDTIALSGTHASDFSIVSPIFPFYIPNGGTAQTVTIQCKPSAVGIKMATLHLITNDSLLYPTPTYPLLCTAVPAPIVPVPTPGYYSEPFPEGQLKFGNTIIGQPVMQTLKIGEIGDDTLNVWLMSIKGHAKDFKIVEPGFPLLIPDKSPAISVVLECNPSAEGLRTATLSLSSNDPARPKITYTLECEGKSPPVPIERPFLTVTFEGQGQGRVTSIPAGIHCDNSNQVCEKDYDLETVVKLNAAANPHSLFNRWGGHPDCEDGQVKMSTSLKCIAYFDLIPLSLAVTVKGQGQVSGIPGTCTSECTYSLAPGQTVNLTTVPAQGWKFGHWSGDCDSSGKVVLDRNKQCQATFVESLVTDVPANNITDQVSLTVEVIGKGQVVTQPEGIDCGNTCSSHFALNTKVILIATPAPGFKFIGWAKGCSGTQNPLTFDLTTSKTCQAQFYALVEGGMGSKPPIDLEEDSESFTVEEPIEEGESEVEELAPPPLPPEATEECPTEGILNYACNAGGRTVTELKITRQGSFANGVLVGTIMNRGWVSNLTIEPQGLVVGGMVTGYIHNRGVIADFEFRGKSIIGGTLAGTIINNSQVDGTFTDVYLAAHTHIKGGKLSGNIIGEVQAPAMLENLTIVEGSYLENVIIGKNVKLPKHLTLGPSVHFIEEFLSTEGEENQPTTPTAVVEEITGIIRLKANAYISGGFLTGHFEGLLEDPPLLENLTITAASYVARVIIGHNVENLGTLADFDFHGRLLQGGTLAGQIINSRGGTLQDVHLAANAQLSGGNLKGTIIGDKKSPALLENVTVVAGSYLENVILGKNVQLPKNVTLGKNVTVLYSPVEPVVAEVETVVTATAMDTQGHVFKSPAIFTTQIKVSDKVRANHALLTHAEAKNLHLTATITPDSTHIGQAAKILLVASYRTEIERTFFMRVGEQWLIWQKGEMPLQAVFTLTALPQMLEVPIFEGDLSEAPGEFTVWIGYQLEEGTMIYNDPNPLHFFVDVAPKSCIAYGVHDEGKNDSQMIKIDLSATLHGVMVPLGSLHRGYDIEGLAIQRDEPDVLYGTSGINAVVNGQKQGGHLYRISRLTGAVMPIGATSFEKVSALAAHPNNDALWGWARNETADQRWNGIIQIDRRTGESVPIKQFDYKQYLVEGLAWSPEGDKLYASGEKGTLWVYDPESQELTTACAKVVSDGKIEGLDMQPNGILLVGVDKDNVTTLLAYDPKACLVVNQRDFKGIRYDDIESIIWPTKECNDQSWLSVEE